MKWRLRKCFCTQTFWIKTFQTRTFRAPDFLDRTFRPLTFWTWTFNPEILDQDVSPPWHFGPGRFAPRFWTRTFRPRTFWTWMFCTQDVLPQDFLDLDVLLQHVSPPNILDQDVSPPDNCFIIQNICFSWKFCYLGEFTSNFSWHCFTIHVTLWRYVRDYATLLEVTLTSMRH